MKRITYQVMKSLNDLRGNVVSEEIHCLCISMAKCVDEIDRLMECRNLGYPSGKRTLVDGYRKLRVDVPNGFVLYHIAQVAHYANKRPPKRFVVVPKRGGKPTDFVWCASYEDALQTKRDLERTTGELYRITN